MKSCKLKSGMRGSVAVLVGVVLFVVMLGTAAVVEAADRGSRASFTVSRGYSKRLEKAHGLIGEQKYDEAQEVLETLASRRRLNGHERALIWQAKAYIFAGRDEFEEAANAFEKSLSFDALPPATANSVRYNLAQTYVMLEEYSRAAATLEDWFVETDRPGADAYYLLAFSYAQSDQTAKALVPALEAVQRVDEPREAWLQLLLSLRLQREEYNEAVPVLEQLAERFPKKLYWTQLSAIYATLESEDRALAAMQVAYEQGWLTSDSELRILAQLYLHHELPYRAARVLERGMAEGKIKDDSEALELVADSWLYAREYDRALDPLRNAAGMAENGEMYLRLAQVYLEQEEWEKAREAATLALRKGGLSDPGSAQLVAGIASYNTRHMEAAKQAFVRAEKYDSSQASAAAWLQHLDRAQASG